VRSSTLLPPIAQPNLPAHHRPGADGIPGRRRSRTRTPTAEPAPVAPSAPFRYPHHRQQSLTQTCDPPSGQPQTGRAGGQADSSRQRWLKSCPAPPRRGKPVKTGFFLPHRESGQASGDAGLNRLFLPAQEQQQTGRQAPGVNPSPAPPFTPAKLRACLSKKPAAQQMSRSETSGELGGRWAQRPLDSAAPVGPDSPAWTGNPANGRVALPREQRGQPQPDSRSLRRVLPLPTGRARSRRVGDPLAARGRPEYF